MHRENVSGKTPKKYLSNKFIFKQLAVLFSKGKVLRIFVGIPLDLFIINLKKVLWPFLMFQNKLKIKMLPSS